MYEKVSVLGFSVTNISCLENQRDMADKLFDGNIASETTLGEAAVRGIRNLLTYITSIYTYQKDYEKLKALENAEGFDEILSKHIKDTAGKYIVFCANLTHMKK